MRVLITGRNHQFLSGAQNILSEMSVCLICQVQNNGHHFGINCCRPCSAFFRRSLQLRLVYKCYKGGRCDITLKNRFSCRACRLAKCYEAGMGEFAGYIVPKIADSPKNHDTPSDGASVSETSVSEEYERVLIRPQTRSQTKHVKIEGDVITEVHRRVDSVFKAGIPPTDFPSVPLTTCQQACLAYERHSQRWPNCTPEKFVYSEIFDLDKHMQSTFADVEYIAEFCMSIKPFAQLPYDTKWLLFKNFWYKFLDIERTFVTCQLLGYERKDYFLVTFDGLAVNLMKPQIPNLDEMCNASPQLLASLLGTTQITVKQTLVDTVKTYRPELFEFIYILMDILWTTPSASHKVVSGRCQEVISTVKSHLAEELYSYYLLEKNIKNYATRVYKLQNIVNAVNKVGEIRKEEGYMSATFNMFKQDIFLNDLK